MLRAALGFVLTASVVTPGQVDTTVSDLQTALAEAPAEFQPPLSDIITALQNLDAAAGTGQTVDLSTIEPDANLIAGMCRARGLPVPNVN